MDILTLAAGDSSFIDCCDQISPVHQFIRDLTAKPKLAPTIQLLSFCLFLSRRCRWSVENLWRSCVEESRSSGSRLRVVALVSFSWCGTSLERRHDAAAATKPPVLPLFATSFNGFVTKALSSCCLSMGSLLPRPPASSSSPPHLPRP